MKKIAVIFVIVVFALQGCQSEKNYDLLRDSAPFPVGAAIVAGNKVDGFECDGLMDSQWYPSFIAKHFNAITVQNAMKMRMMRPKEDIYSFEKSDLAVDFATKHNLRLHGHCLVWHVSEPEWMKKYEEDSLKMGQLMEDHIRTVVSRYKGRVASWDVVNEAINDGSGKLRENAWYKTMGLSAIDKAFRLTKEVDPNVLTFYNEYGLVIDSLKMEGTLKMLDELKKKGTPVDGVGLQSHIYMETFKLERFANLLKELVKRNYRVHISELDININLKTETKYPILSKDQEEKQRQMAYDVVKIYMDIVPEHLRYGITVWGISDKYTWARTHQKRLEWPLLFNDDYKPKSMYFGLLDAMK